MFLLTVEEKNSSKFSVFLLRVICVEEKHSHISHMGMTSANKSSISL